jgi:arabinogalactan oligomer/maltooligosaccharide transport system permease protein
MIERFLYNRQDNKYTRKNQYLLELSELQESGNLETIKSFKKNKKEHRYNIDLNEFRTLEKKFLSHLKRDLKIFKSNNKNNYSKRVITLKLRLLNAKNKKEFYKDYIDFHYDAEYNYNVSKLEMNELPKVIENIVQFEKSIEQQKGILKGLDSSSQTTKQDELAEFKKQQKDIFVVQNSKIKQKLKDGIISKKAYKNILIEFSRKQSEEYTVKSYELPSIKEKSILRNQKFELKEEYKKEIAYINEHVSEVRRNTPQEDESRNPWIYLTLLLPGVGQLLNGQKVKGLLMLLVSFFVYFIAIPYALGFGNYRGDGIAGLISLAEGAGKLDRSIIFLIEGIVAIFLIAIASGLVYMSMKEVISVQNDRIKGIRPNNWYETKIILFEEGFPFVVTLPALITVIFIVVVPITTSILLSFTGMDPSNQAKFGWSGLQNYKMLIQGEGVAGGPFWKITFWTLLWTFSSTTLAVLIGFVLALILNSERIIFKKFFRSIFLLPWAVPAFITILFFSIMFGSGGSLTELLGGIQVKNSTVYARITLILMQGWLGSAYVFLLSTGVLQSIPSDLYEAADIDGSSKMQKLRKITLPIVLFQTAPLLVGQYVFNFNNFSIIYLFNGGGPYNPAVYGNIAGTTDLLISYVFKLTIEQQYQSIGAAIIFVVSLGLMFFAFLGFINSKAFKEEKL